MGRADRPKGLLKTDPLSGKVIPFLQEPDYYLQKGSYYHQKNNFSKALLFLKKAIEIEPGNADHHYNLACLLSKAGQLKEANRIFKHIVSNMESGMTECLFLMAINYGLMDDLPRAKQYLLKYLQASPEGEMAEEARELLLAIDEDEEDEPVYNPPLSMEENLALEKAVDGLAGDELRDCFQDPLFKGLLRRALYQGSDGLKEKIIRLYGAADCPEAEARLKEFVINPWVKERLRQVALLELKNKLSGAGLCRIFAGGRIVQVNLGGYPLLAPVWRKEWQAVLECTFANMRQSPHYSEEFFADVQAIWLDFINSVYPHMPRVVKPQTWAAALEYCLARFHFLDLTQSQLAEEYNVSVGSVSRKFKLINRTLDLEQKAYRNMLAYLAQGELEQR